MKLHWSLLVGSLVATALTATPAEAGKLTFWQFSEDKNRLIFQTEETVQPKAQLIFNPTRVVIDLPQTTLGHSLVNQPVGEIIKEVRVGQFNQDTTRLVVELAPGYTLDPEKVKIRGESPNRWSVDLPRAQRQNRQAQAPVSPPSRNFPRREQPSPTRRATPPKAVGETDHPQFQVTRSGLLLRLDRSPEGEIEVERSGDQKQISFRLPNNVQLPSDLPPVLPIRNYGISYAEFRRARRNEPATVILHVNEESPNWQGFPTLIGKGGVVLLPQGGMGTVRGNLESPPVPGWVEEKTQQAERVVVETVDLVNNRLLVQGNRPIEGTGSWDRLSGVYEITIPNAELADPVRGPRLTRNSPVSQIRVRQKDEETVVVQVQSAPGVSVIDQVNNQNQNTLAIALRTLQPVTPRNHLSNQLGTVRSQPQAIRVPQAKPNPTTPEITSWTDCYKYISYPYPEPSQETTKKTLTINGINLTFSVPNNYQIVKGASLAYTDLYDSSHVISILPPDTKRADHCIQQAIRTGSEGGSSIPQIDSISLSVKNQEDIENLSTSSSFKDYKHIRYVSIDGNFASLGQYVSSLGCDYSGVGKIVRIPLENKVIDILVSGKCDGSTTAVGIEYYESLSKIFHQVLGSLKID